PGCPSGTTCNLESGTCEIGEIPQRPPILAAQLSEVTGFGRYLVEVPLDLTVSDLNNDPVSVELAYRIGTDASSELTVAATFGPFSDTSTARLEPVRWPLSDTTLPVTLFDTDGDGEGDLSGVSGRERIQLELTPIDATGERGEPVRIDSVPVGNTPPEVRIDAPGLDQEVAGEVSIELELADAEEDLATIQIEFRCSAGRPASFSCPPNTQDWMPAEIVLGTAEGLVSGPLNPGAGALPKSVVLNWDSRAPSNIPSDNGGFGVGFSNAVVDLRARVQDRSGGSTAGRTIFGPPAEARVVLVNQQPPEVISLSAPRTDFVGGASVVPITFVVADEEADVVDVRVQFDLDGREQWSDATEYRHARSEGRLSLTT
ncbi:MAG: hypothetical protein AAFY60_20285, partial [Myxococcota bacterium]